MPDFAGATMESTAKACAYAATLTAVGACAARWGVRWALSAPVDPGVHTDLMRRLARVGAWAGASAVVAVVARLWAHTAVAFGLAEALQWDSLSLVAIDSRWGAGWRYQLLAAVGMLVCFLWSARRPQSGWLLATASALGACVSVGLLGHAAGDPTRVALHAAHVAGAGIWLGALAAIVVATRESSDARHAGVAPPPDTLDQATGPASRSSASSTRVALLRQFSVVAMPGSLLLFTSGAWASWLYVGSLLNLARTFYGNVLLAKLVCVAGILLCGFTNWRRFRTPSGTTARVQVVYVELALAVLALAVTSILTELEHPGVQE